MMAIIESSQVYYKAQEIRKKKPVLLKENKINGEF